MKAILETKDLVKYYGSGDNLVKAIDHTDIRVEPGEFAAVVAGPTPARCWWKDGTFSG